MVDYVYREFCQCIVYSIRCLNIRSRIVKNTNDDKFTLGLASMFPTSQYSQYPSCLPYRIPSQRVCMIVCIYMYVLYVCTIHHNYLLVARAFSL